VEALISIRVLLANMSMSVATREKIKEEKAKS
jgi:hypothetical protein